MYQTTRALPHAGRAPKPSSKGRFDNGEKSKQQTNHRPREYPQVSVITHNLRVYSSKNASWKKDVLANDLSNTKTPTIVLTQETWEKHDDVLEIDGFFFSRKQRKEKRRSRNCTQQTSNCTLEKGQPDLIRPGPIAGSCRAIGLALKFTDAAGKTVTIFVISTYLPCLTFEDDKYDARISQVKELMAQKPKDATLLIGGDLSASIGTEPSRSYRHIGPYGNPHYNDRGSIIRDLLEDLDLCSVSTFFRKNNHDTWSFNGDDQRAFQIDHILTERKELKRFRNCGTIKR